MLSLDDAIDDKAPGWSFIQPITTSHFSGHYFEKPGQQVQISIDAYSCKALNCWSLLSVCDKHFYLSDWRENFIEREIEIGGKGAFWIWLALVPWCNAKTN